MNDNGGEGRTLDEVQNAVLLALKEGIQSKDTQKLEKALNRAEELNVEEDDLVNEARKMLKKMHESKDGNSYELKKQRPGSTNEAPENTLARELAKDQQDNEEFHNENKSLQLLLQDREAALADELAGLSPENRKKLLTLDQHAADLLAKGQNDQHAAIEAMEMGLVFRRSNFGLNSVQVYVYREKLAKEYNRMSVILMEESNNFALCAEYLEKAQILGELYPEVVAVTYNNLACFFRKKGQHRTALNYLQEALNVEKTLADSPINISDTHLNLCTVYSELKKHKEAQFHIKMAIRHLQLELFGRVLGTFEDPTEVEMKNDSVEEGRVITYGVALFNLAVQLEFLGKWEQSMDSYDKASTFARFHNLPEQIRQTIKNARTAAYPKLQRKISKEK
eukprot:jgi/Bigna1/137535/aug1.39_g12243